jgi:hypothetical protein
MKNLSLGLLARMFSRLGFSGRGIPTMSERDG